MPVPVPPPSLARRLARRAVDLLVIGFLATVGLSVGRQLVEWWRTDPQAATPNLAGLNGADLDWNRTPITLQFGEAATSIERIPLRGDYKRLDDVLTKTAQSVVASSQLPVTRADEPEREWLAALQTAPPVLWDSTQGNVYRRNEPLPSFVATRFAEPGGSDEQPLTQRIVAWGLAFPSGKDEWTIYVFRPETTRAANALHGIDISLPDGSRRLTHMRGADGCQWLVFQGRGDLASWVQHFDQQFGTKADATKTVGTQSASLKYRTGQTRATGRTAADVQIRRERDGSLTGVLWSASEGEAQ